MRKWMFLLLSCLLVGSLSAREPIKTLLITGQNNHNWPVSHVVLQRILENSTLFQVDLAISPAAGEDMSGFVLDFTPYELVVLDYNGDAWPEETNQRFLRYVEQGGGVVVYHAADNAFAGWPAYNEICALGGWENRDEKAGPYVYWQGDGLVKDNTPGVGGSHGKQHEYELHARNQTHPIMQGLPATWKHGKDELYDRMRGPGNIQDCLFTAYSSKEMGGSGREEPLIFTVNYGKARIFHTMLGHAGESVAQSPALQCTGFQVTLLRGAEWAATGLVTQPVPTNFPTAQQATFRLDYR